MPYESWNILGFVGFLFVFFLKSSASKIFIFYVLFTRYRCRSHIQDKRTVHLFNCMLSLKSQMTYWAKVLLIAAYPSAQHPKSLIPPALKQLTSALKHAGNWLNLQCCHIKSTLSALILSWQVRGKFTSLKLTSTSPYCLAHIYHIFSQGDRSAT